MSSISDEIAKLNSFSMPQQEDPAQAKARLAKWAEDEALRIKNSPYAPSRLDYFVARALQGELAGQWETGRWSMSEKDAEMCAAKSLLFAKAAIAAIDSSKTE